MSNQFQNILQFEEGGLTKEETIAMFAELVESGDIWRLPDQYQDDAALLISKGMLNTRKTNNLN